MTKIIRVVCALLVNQDNEIFISQRPYDKPYAYFWEFPGGKIEKTEKPLTALKRELEEELGIILDTISAHKFMRYVYAYPEYHIDMTVFHCIKWHGHIKLRENQRGSRWAPSHNIPSTFMLPGSLPIIERLQLTI